MKITKAVYAGSSARVSGKPGLKLPEFAFIGRSNVGKSSLINMLTGQKRLALTSQTPGKTKVVNHFLINDRWYLVDLPGYGYAKLPESARKELQKVVADYVFNSEELVMLFVLIDCRHDIGKVDRDFLAELGENGVPFAIIFTKGDKLGRVALAEQIARDQEILSQEWEEFPDMLVSSAENGLGREEILNYIEEILNNL